MHDSKEIVIFFRCSKTSAILSRISNDFFNKIVLLFSKIIFLKVIISPVLAFLSFLISPISFSFSMNKAFSFDINGWDYYVDPAASASVSSTNGEACISITDGGNDIVILIYGSVTTDYRAAESYNNDPAGAPLIHIEYY